MKLIAKVADIGSTIIGLSLIGYVCVSTLWIFQDSCEYYTNFIFAVVVVSLLIVISKLLQQRKPSSGGYGFLFWFRLFLSGLALIAGIVSILYIRLEATRLDMVTPFINNTDVVMGIILIAVIITACWFLWGSLVTLLIVLMILYFFFGHHIPGLLSHPGYKLSYIVSYLGMSTTHGVYWFARITADKIFLLVVFSGLIINLGLLPLSMELGKALSGFTRGGVAFPAIVGSAIVGTVTGQAVANVALTGNVTIPLMKQRGFKPALAGAIEAVASTSGQITPPILGLAGFIIAGILNLPYIMVALAALLPAILYFVAVVVGVLVLARAYQLPLVRESADMKAIYHMLPGFLIPFIFVIVLLLLYYSPSLAGLAGIVTALLAYLLQKRLQISFRDLFNGFKWGFRLGVELSVLGLGIGAFAQTALITNFGLSVTQFFEGTIIVQSLPLALIGTMIISLILGMGMPTPVAYIVVALTMSPLLVAAGLDPFVAHMFVFYFAVFSTMTPPIALAVLAASRIAGAKFLATAGEALKLAGVSFVIPFAFAFNPELLAFPHVSLQCLLISIEVALVIFVVATANYGYMLKIGVINIKERIMFGVTAAAGILSLSTGQVMYIALFLGLMVASVLLLMMRQRHYELRKRKNT